RTSGRRGPARWSRGLGGARRALRREVAAWCLPTCCSMGTIELVVQDLIGANVIHPGDTEDDTPYGARELAERLAAARGCDAFGREARANSFGSRSQANSSGGSM